MKAIWIFTIFLFFLLKGLPVFRSVSSDCGGPPFEHLRVNFINAIKMHEAEYGELPTTFASLVGDNPRKRLFLEGWDDYSVVDRKVSEQTFLLAVSRPLSSSKDGLIRYVAWFDMEDEEFKMARDSERIIGELFHHFGLALPAGEPAPERKGRQPNYTTENAIIGSVGIILASLALFKLWRLLGLVREAFEARASLRLK